MIYREIGRFEMTDKGYDAKYVGQVTCVEQSRMNSGNSIVAIHVHEKEDFS